MATVPTSDLATFDEMLRNPNKPVKIIPQENKNIVQILKDGVINYPSDPAGCGHIRSIFPFTYLNSIYGRTGVFSFTQSYKIITDENILETARSIWFQRTMNPAELGKVRKIKELQKKYGYKMLYDLDDVIWQSDDDMEGLPEYNFGKGTVSPIVQNTCVEIMNMCDTICVSSQYLAKFISDKFKIPMEKFKVVKNTVPKYLFGGKRKPKLKTKLVKPRVIWTASPTHWHEEKKMRGDMVNPWYEWLLKSIKDDKIHFIQMGGNCPWFFKSVEHKITCVPWKLSYDYPQTIRDLRPDFGIGPLVPNHFNFAKSDIKAIEQYAIGSVFMGSVFDKFESPYDDCFVKIGENYTIDQFDDKFKEINDIEVYNGILDQQYDYLVSEGRYTESAKFVEEMMKLL